MIVPHQFRDSPISAYLEIPLDAYIETLYRTKTWSVEVGATITFPTATYSYSLTGTYNRQFFAGPENPWGAEFVQGSTFESDWAAREMTAATRRVVYDTDGSGLPLKFQDPQSYPSSFVDDYDGQKVIAGYMAWVGLISGSVTTTFGGGSPSTISFTNSKQAFALPCFGWPLPWGVYPDPTTVVSGIIKASSISDPWKIFIQGEYGCSNPSASGFFGSMENFTDQLGPSITATLVDLSGASRTIVGAGRGISYGADSISGSVILTAASSW
jgi:hypothetical protein